MGPDEPLYIVFGQPHNGAPRDKLPLYCEMGIGGIVRVTSDGALREVFTTGPRNLVGMTFYDRGRL